MAIINIRLFYHRNEFVSLPAGSELNPDVLFTQVSALELGSFPVLADVMDTGEGVFIEFDRIPTEEDIDAIDAVVAAFVGGVTTSEPFVLESFDTVTASSSTPVTKVTGSTPPLDAGTYQVIIDGSHRMQVGSGADHSLAQYTVQVSGEGAIVQQDSWPLSSAHAYNLPLTLEVTAGQTISALVQLAKIGGGVGVAEMSGVRITADKIS